MPQKKEKKTQFIQVDSHENGSVYLGKFKTREAAAKAAAKHKAEQAKKKGGK